MVTKAQLGRWVGWRQALPATLTGGVVFLVLQTVLTAIFFEHSSLLFLKAATAMVLGQEAFATPSDNVPTLLLGLLVHLILSVLFGLPHVALVHRFSTSVSVALGAAAGGVLYLINFNMFVTIWPWFDEIRNWAMLLSHLAFGLSVAWVYKLILSPHQGRPLESSDRGFQQFP